MSGLPALADDSGLCVEALDGAPGIHSARWANGDFAAAMARIRRELFARGAAKPWRAHFVSALALCWPDGLVETFEGRVDGELVFPRGEFWVSATIRFSSPTATPGLLAK